MHIASVKYEHSQDFTIARWNTYRNSLRRWLGLRGECRDAAEERKHCLDLDFGSIPEDAAFHPTCYRRFIDKSAIAKVERRLVRERERGDDAEDSRSEAIPSASSRTTPSPTSPTTKRLRSGSGLPISSSGPVLPALCIMCKKEDKYIVKAGRRQREALSKAETLTAGKLQKAAKLKDDHSVLIHIKDKDCVALEVQYHKSCYLQYTRFLSGPARPETEQNEATLDISYGLFCERIIQQRLLVNQEVLRMSQLTKAFIELVKSNEGLDASNYRQDTLKRRLSRDFPQLVFQPPTKRNVSELVFAETLSTETLLDMLPCPAGAESTQSGETSQTDGKTKERTAELQTAPEDAGVLYAAALLLKTLLGDTPGTSCPWPPTAGGLNVTGAQTVVPLELYNLVSWITGAAEEPTLEHFVHVADDLHLKVLSVCQDIVYLASKQADT